MNGGGRDFETARCESCHRIYTVTPCDTCRFRRVKLLNANAPVVAAFNIAVRSGVIKEEFPVAVSEIKELCKMIGLQDDFVTLLITVVLPEYQTAVSQIRAKRNGK